MTRIPTLCHIFACIAVLAAHATAAAGAPAAAPAAVAAGAPTAADNIHRLPTDVTPTFQAIRLTLDAAQPNYTGSVRVELRVAKTTPSIQFHAQEMTLDKVVLRGKNGTVTLKPTSGEDGFVTAAAPSPIAAGEYTLEIGFSNEFDRRSTSLYRMETGGEWYAFSQFEAVDARLAFPCWDEPSFKFPYQMTLIVPQAHQAISNTPIESETSAKGMKTVVFRRTKPLPSYLLAVATGPLEYVPVPGTSIPTRVVTVKGQTEWAGAAVQITPPILAALEKYFGSRYPYEKLDLIGVPEYTYGAMENPGAITYSDRLLLFDPKTMSVRERRLLATITAHEIAHMWFGDVVTMKWWDDLWLNESFAEWMGNKITAEVYPDLQVEIAQLEGAQRAMNFDALLSTRAMRQPVVSMGNPLQAADALAYQKGEVMIGMFEQWMGPEVFRRGVLAYLKKYEWGNADASDLWSSLSEAAGQDLSGPMSTFLDQPGVPLVEADILEDGRIRLSQRRFLNYGSEAPAPQSWSIPVRFEYFDGTKVRTKSVMLSDAEMTVATDGGSAPVWVHPKAGESGYYRWYVDSTNLQRLADVAPKLLTPRERVGYLGNLDALLSAGVIQGDDYLRLVAGFAQDPRTEVIGVLPGALGGIQVQFITPDLEESFAAYVRRVLGPGLKRIGLDRTPGEDEAVSLVRPRLIGWLADEGKDETLLAHAEQLARSFIADRSSVDPSLIGVALSLSAIRGDASLFNTYRARFEAATVPTDRQPFLSALGSFRDPKLREEALSYVLTGPLRPHEMGVIPLTMKARIEYQDQVFDWMTRNYAAIASKIPPVYAPYMVRYASGCSEPRMEKAKAFFVEPAHSPPGTSIELARVAESINDCVGLRERQGQGVARYLTQVAEAR